MSLFRLFQPYEGESIIGQRTFLRMPRVDDFREWTELRQTSRPFLEPWEPTWTDDEFSRASFRYRVRAYGHRAQNDEGYAFLVFDKEHGRMVGGLNVAHVRRGVSQSASLGYWMGEPYAGKGLMKDALLAFIGVANSRYGLHRLEAACIAHNDRSRYLLLSCGFKPEGLAKSYVKIAGQWQDHLLFGRVVD